MLPFPLEKMSQLQKCKELLADLNNQISDMERSQNSRITSVERVCPSVRNPATTSTSPLLPSERSNTNKYLDIPHGIAITMPGDKDRGDREVGIKQPQKDQDIARHGPEHFFALVELRTNECHPQKNTYA